MSERIDYIPFDKIDKIEIYENKNQLTLSVIAAIKRPDYAITGVFYNTSWKPTCHLKKDGKVLATAKEVYRGYRWNKPSDFKMVRVPNESKNYLNHYACCTLIADGKPYPDNLIFYNKDVGGTRGRTAIGIKGDSLVLYASQDGTKDAKTPEKLRDYLYGKGVTSLIMGDGGGKVNYYAQGYKMEGKAKSQNLILVYLKKNTTPPEPTPPKKEENRKEDNGLNIIKQYVTKNPRYRTNQVVKKTGFVQHSTGTPGASAKSIINSFGSSNARAEAHFVIDDTGIYQILPLNIRCFHVGGSGNTTHVGSEVCEPIDTRFISCNWHTLSRGGQSNTEFAVSALQRELVARGYDTNGIDGVFGGGTESAVRKFQKDNGLSVDGAVGKNTLLKLQNRTGSYVKYNPAKNQAYFENVYNKAVYACAYTLKQIGVTTVNSNTVISHAEAYKKGIGSNHADVGHWFPLHGKSMDDFREDVRNYMVAGKLPYGDKPEEKPVTPNPVPPSKPVVPNPSEELDKAWDKACKKGIFDGSNPNNPCTRRQMAAVLDRLGLLD